MPVGFKNATPGTIAPAINAIKAARGRQTFLGISGDGGIRRVHDRQPRLPSCPARRRQRPNYSAKHITEAERSLVEAGLDKAFLVDCSHGNSGWDAPPPARCVAECCGPAGLGHQFIGAMLESNLVGGSQPFGVAGRLVYGQSSTDACIDWDMTERLVIEIAESL